MEKRLKNKGKRGPAVLSVLIATMLAVTLFAALPADGSGSSRESRTLGAAGDYHAGDVAVINSIIENNGLEWTPDDPESWPADWEGVTWNDASPKRITGLFVPFMNLTGALDLSGLTSLTYLNCIYNYLTELDLSGLTSLTSLSCDRNYLTEQDLSGLTSLTSLNCGNNSLTSLDVSGLTSLTQLSCSSNYLTELDVSGLTSLTQLSCSSNYLTELDVSGLTSLEYLYCDRNYLTELDLSDLASLVRLNCDRNYLTELDLSDLASLSELYCSSNYLTELDLSGLASLSELYCSSNYLTELDLSGLASLTGLNCSSNHLTELDVSSLTSLEYLVCTDNYLTELDVSNLSYLGGLQCDMNLMADKNKVTLASDRTEDSYQYVFSAQKEFVEITDGMSEAEISKAIDDVIKGGVYSPVVIGTVTSNTGTLTINIDSDEDVYWRATYTGGTLELNGNGYFYVDRGGSISVDKMLVKDGAKVVAQYDGTISIGGDLIIESASLASDTKSKVTIGGDLTAKGIAPDDYAVDLNGGDITILGDATSSGTLFYASLDSIVTIGGNVTAEGDYAFFGGSRFFAHIGGDVSVPNGCGLSMQSGTVKIDGTLTVKEGEAYIYDVISDAFLFADDFSFKDMNDYDTIYSYGWNLYLGYNGSDITDGGDGEGSEIGGEDGNGSEAGNSNGNGTVDGDGSGNGDGNSGSEAGGNDRLYAIIVFAATVAALGAVVYLSVRKK